MNFASFLKLVWKSVKFDFCVFQFWIIRGEFASFLSFLVSFLSCSLMARLYVLLSFISFPSFFLVLLLPSLCPPFLYSVFSFCLTSMPFVLCPLPSFWNSFCLSCSYFPSFSIYYFPSFLYSFFLSILCFSFPHPCFRCLVIFVEIFSTSQWRKLQCFILLINVKDWEL